MTSRPSPPNNTTSDGNTGTTSEKKIEANRKNAQFSTGPTSVEGKVKSSRNASKHGLLIKDVVITTRANKEDQTEFDALLAELRECYGPIDIAEDLLVREPAVSYWRSARALRCERADVTCAGTAAPDQSEPSEVEVAILTLAPAAEAYHSLLRSSRGIRFLLRKAEQARDEVKISNSVSAELCRWLAPGQNWAQIAYSGEALLAALENETEELTARKGIVERAESEWSNDQRERSAIPSKEVLDRIHRYETSNVRHRYRVEKRLEQLQARPRENAKTNSGRNSDTESPQDTQFCETKPTGSDDEGLRKGPRSVGLSEQTSEYIATSPVETEVTGGD
jgi:hypothetical protein